MGVRGQGLGFRVSGLGVRGQGLGFRLGRIPHDDTDAHKQGDALTHDDTDATAGGLSEQQPGLAKASSTQDFRMRGFEALAFRAHGFIGCTGLQAQKLFAGCIPEPEPFILNPKPQTPNPKSPRGTCRGGISKTHVRGRPTVLVSQKQPTLLEKPEAPFETPRSRGKTTLGLSWFVMTASMKMHLPSA